MHSTLGFVLGLPIISGSAFGWLCQLCVGGQAKICLWELSVQDILRIWYELLLSGKSISRIIELKIRETAHWNK